MSTKLLRVEFPRDNEPDLLIMVEYKNIAALDQGTEQAEKPLKKFKDLWIIIQKRQQCEKRCDD